MSFFRLMNSPAMDLWLQHGVLFEGDDGMNKAVTTLWLENETLVEVKLTKGMKRAHVRYDDLRFDLPFMVFIGLAADRDWGFVGVL
jgi:hypothetical protein